MGTSGGCSQYIGGIKDVNSAIDLVVRLYCDYAAAPVHAALPIHS
jgi:hypothetical protein